MDCLVEMSDYQMCYLHRDEGNPKKRKQFPQEIRVAATTTAARGQYGLNLKCALEFTPLSLTFNNNRICTFYPLILQIGICFQYIITK